MLHTFALSDHCLFGVCFLFPRPLAMLKLDCILTVVALALQGMHLICFPISTTVSLLPHWPLPFVGMVHMVVVGFGCLREPALVECPTAVSPLIC